MQTQHLPAEYEISTDAHRLNVEVIHKFLAEDSYWSPGIPRSVVERAIENSLCFGVYHRAAQVGFARVVTDKSTFALLADVLILCHRVRRGGHDACRRLIEHDWWLRVAVSCAASRKRDVHSVGFLRCSAYIALV